MYEAQWSRVANSSGTWLDLQGDHRRRGFCLPLLGWMWGPLFLDSVTVWLPQLQPLVSQVQPSQLPSACTCSRARFCGIFLVGGSLVFRQLLCCPLVAAPSPCL